MDTFNNNANQSVLNAVAGSGNTVQNTSLAAPAMDMSTGFGATMGGPSATPNYTNTVQGIMGQNSTPFNPYTAQTYNPNTSHAIGRDNWTSAIGLDQAAIMRNIGLGG